MEILKLREEKERISEAACWFHEKWKVPMEAYRESMQAATENNSSYSTVVYCCRRKQDYSRSRSDRK